MSEKKSSPDIIVFLLAGFGLLMLIAAAVN